MNFLFYNECNFGLDEMHKNIQILSNTLCDWKGKRVSLIRFDEHFNINYFSQYFKDR